MKRIILLVVITLFVSISIAWSYKRGALHYHQLGQACLFQKKENPLMLGNRIANGEAITKQYAVLLDSPDFDQSHFLIEPLFLAYGFYIVAERIGIAEARNRQKWVYSYIPADARDMVASVIYRKYARAYLNQCFSQEVGQPSGVFNGDASTNFELYMHTGH